MQSVPRIAHAHRLNFLSGLVTIEGAMIALIDLPNLLSMPAEPADDHRSIHAITPITN